MPRFSVEAVFKAIDKVTAPVTKMQNRVNKFSRGFSTGLKSVNRGLNNVAGGMRRFGLASVVAFGLVSAGMADIIRTGADFEQQIVNASAKLTGIKRGTAEYASAVAALEKEARRMGATTEFTASQSARALNTLVTAGFDVNQSIAALPGVIDLATTAEMELAEASDIATGALGAFNLKVKDATKLQENLTRVNDVLAKTATTSKNTMVDLAEALKDGGPAAKLAGADVETFGAIAGRMADGLIRGTKAGTTMKNMFLKIAKPSETAQKLFKRWNISTKDGRGNMRDIVDILGDLEGSLKKLGTADRAAAIEEIFGKRAIAGVSILLEKGIDNLRKYRNELRNSSGASKEMAATMRDSLQGRLKALFSAIESVKLSIFTATKGPINDIVTSMTEWVRVNDKLIGQKVNEKVQWLIDNRAGIAKFAKAVFIFGSVILGLIVILKTLVLVMTAVNLVMAANPVVLITLAIIALIAIVALAVTTIVFFRKELLGWWDSLSTGEKILISLMSPIILLTVLVAKFVDSWGEIKLLFRDIASLIDPLIQKFQKFADIVSGDLSAFWMDEGGLASDIGQQYAGRRSGAPTAEPEVMSQQQRIDNYIQFMEKRDANKSEITIRDETGRAEVTSGKLGGGVNLESSGEF